MKTTRITAVAIGLAAMCAAGLSAQTQETKTTTKNKVEITGREGQTVIGCLNRNPEGDYILTKTGANSAVKPTQYAVISSAAIASAKQPNHWSVATIGSLSPSTNPSGSATNANLRVSGCSRS